MEDEQKMDKWHGDQGTYNCFLSNFKSVLRIKKVFWTIDDTVPDLVIPVQAQYRLGTDEERPNDAVTVSNYEKESRLRAIDYDVALGVLEKSLGPIPKTEIKHIINKDNYNSKRKLIKSLKKLHKVYGYNTENLVNELNQRMDNLPTAMSPNEVPSLINSMQAIQSELNELEDPLAPGEYSGWTGSDLIIHLNKKIKCTYFDALKVLSGREKSTWNKTIKEYRSAAQRWSLENEFTGSKSAGKVDKKVISAEANSVNGADIKQFASMIAAVTKAGLIPSSSDTSSICWNCGSSGHKANKCSIGWCKNCLIKKSSNPYHNPSDCPNKMFEKRK